MCISCELEKIEGINTIGTSNPAIDDTGHRTIWGPYVERDFEKIYSKYNTLSRKQLRKYISFFFEPRLSEILGPLELLQRMSEKSFSKIRGITFDLAYNPLSILTMKDNKIIRIKTQESEVLHKSMEKLALRWKTLQEINIFFDRIFGVQIIFACSCGVGMVYSKNMKELLESEYYCQREGYGRMFDSDVLGKQGNLFFAESIDLVPKELLTISRDVGTEEVSSYHRYFNTLKKITEEPIVFEFKNPSHFFNI
jgi:hypothetical protein